MSQILAVFGATGQQGSSVVTHVLNDPELSQKYKIRAITRDPSAAKSQALAEKGIEVVQADVFDRASIEAALAGVHTVFAMTNPDFGPNAVEVEYNTAKTIADVAVEKGLSYIIFSTLPSVAEITGGKCTTSTPFEAKAKAEKYIRGLPIKSAFVSLGAFMENFHTQPFMAPKKGEDGVWVLTRPCPPHTCVPQLDAGGDTGKYVGAILAEPEKFEGKTLRACPDVRTFDELCEIISKHTGEKVVYKQVSREEFEAGLLAWGIPGPLVDVFGPAFTAFGEFGYYGPGEEEDEAWAAENARGKLTTFEEYLERHPLTL